jgi:hypothetical protein
MAKMANFRDMSLFLRFTSHIVFEEFKDREVIRHILSLHLPFGGFPGRGRHSGPCSLDDENFSRVNGLSQRMEKDTGPEKDPPSLGWMFHIGIAFLRVKGGAFCASYQTGLEDIVWCDGHNY